MQSIKTPDKGKEYFKVYLKVKGIKKRNRKIKPFHIFLANTDDLNLPKLIPIGDKALDWCELNMKEIHSDMFFSFVVNEERGDFNYEMPFDDRNILLASRDML